MRNRNSRRFGFFWSILLVTAALCTGCAIGNVHQYREARFTTDDGGGKSVALAVRDLRASVVSGKVKESAVGVSRGGFGNPFAVTTASEKPLADDMAASVAASLDASGYKTAVVAATPGEEEAKVLERLKSAGGVKLLLLDILGWGSDTFMNTALEYDLLLRIFDPAGTKLAEKAVRGRDDLGGSAMNPPGHAKKAVPVAYQQKLEELFTDPAVRAALH